jgi:Na+/melibiose symporter-like transporter
MYKIQNSCLGHSFFFFFFFFLKKKKKKKQPKKAIKMTKVINLQKRNKNFIKLKFIFFLIFFFFFFFFF